MTHPPAARSHFALFVVHSHPERVKPLLEAMHGVGQRIVAARTAREAMAILEGAAQRIRVAFVAPVVGTSRAHDIMKLILRRFPQVDCVVLSRPGAQRLARTVRKAQPAGPGERPRDQQALMLGRLRKVLALQHALTGSS